MAKLHFENPQEEVHSTIIEENVADELVSPTEYQSDNEYGLSQEELNDANKIKVTIEDEKTPLVVLFGPPACGKTMTLVRLTRYLKSKGFSVQPVSSFRPKYDKHFNEICKNFDRMIDSEDAAQSTSKISFLLVQVLLRGKPICQILEGPGEYYFNPKEPNAPFPKYVHAVIGSNNRKIWAIMLEPDRTNKRMGVEERKAFVNKVHQLKTNISPKDKVMFIFNKIDETPFVNSPGSINYSSAFQQTANLYPNIFVPFKNVHPITKLWRSNNFGFIAFQSGFFSEASDGTLTFKEGHEVYPKKLWEYIYKRIRG